MLLTAEHISKSFPGVRALDGVPFDLRVGEVHALVGENGAGKSTLIKILTGAQRADSGTMRLRGEAIAPGSPLEAQRLGIAAVYQEVDLVPGLSLAENIWLGREARRLGFINRRAANRRASEAMARLGIEADLSRQAGACSVAVRQMAAIARSIDLEASVLVLDEPTASLDGAETARLFEVVRTLTGRGLGVVFITHFLDQVFGLADRVTVLRNGRHVATHEIGEVTRLRLVAEMLGRTEDEAAVLQSPRRGGPVGEASAGAADHASALRAIGIARGRRIGPIDLELRRGEILGLAGLLGSGRTETARLLAGADRAGAGSIEVEGFRGRWRGPREAMRAGVGLAPEDRRADAICPSLSVRENMLLALQARRGVLRRIRSREQAATVAGYVEALGVATRDAETPAGTLSGGNQQKVVLARWLAAEPTVLILDEPTRGVDVGARADIERLIDGCCERGLAVMLISSEFDEVIRLGHRVLVLRDGRAVAELEGEAISIDRIMGAIAGSADA